MTRTSATRPARPKHRPPIRASLLALTLSALCGTALPQTDPARLIERGADPNYRSSGESREWAESAVPPAPAFDAGRVLPIGMPPYTSLKIGVDPQTLQITPEGIVRYVVVATSSSGAVNAFYEGVRCETDESRTYARWTGGSWQAVETQEWRRIPDVTTNHTKALAQQGLCRGRAPRVNTADMVRELRRPEQLRY